MPNDMSPFSPPDVVASLTTRTQRYCARADTLSRDPALTQSTAAKALDHLGALQADIRSTRLQQSCDLRTERGLVEAPYVALETSLKNSRAALSDALLRAIPDSNEPYGLVPQGTRSGLPAEGPTKPCGATETPTGSALQAVSACRALLDLESLRPFLSDAALRDAIARYSNDTGRHDVAGVAYAVLPPSALLNCDVY